MATVLAEYTTEDKRYVLRFLWAKNSMKRIFIKKCFLFTVESVCEVKRFHLTDKRFADDEEVETEVKRLLCCRFQCTGKAIEQVYQCWWRICREINVLSSFEYHIFYVLYPFVTYLWTLPGICTKLSCKFEYKTLQETKLVCAAILLLWRCFFEVSAGTWVTVTVVFVVFLSPSGQMLEQCLD
jgi:hypothetical protein